MVCVRSFSRTQCQDATSLETRQIFRTRIFWREILTQFLQQPSWLQEKFERRRCKIGPSFKELLVSLIVSIMFKLILTLFTVDLLFSLVLEVQGGNEKCCICHKRFNKYFDCKLFVPSRSYEQYFLEAFGVEPNTPGRSGSICRTCKQALHEWKTNRKPAHQVGLGPEMVTKLNFVVLSLSVLNISVPFF